MSKLLVSIVGRGLYVPISLRLSTHCTGEKNSKSNEEIKHYLGGTANLTLFLFNTTICIWLWFYFLLLQYTSLSVYFPVSWAVPSWQAVSHWSGNVTTRPSRKVVQAHFSDSIEGLLILMSYYHMSVKKGKELHWTPVLQHLCVKQNQISRLTEKSKFIL